MCNSMGTVITETHHFYSSASPPKEGRDNNESSRWMAGAQSVGTLPWKKRVAGSRPAFSCPHGFGIEAAEKIYSYKVFVVAISIHINCT